MTKNLLTAAAFTIALAVPATADPSVGFGISLAFGGGNVETGVGLRVFSDDQPEEFVASLGVDYMFGSQRVRPTVGGAYLGDDYYVGVDLGYDLGGGGLDYGVSAGGVNTDNADEPTPPVVIVARPPAL